MLKRLTQNRVERKVGPNNVLFHPHLATEALNLLPQAVQILKKNKKGMSFKPSTTMVLIN